MRWVFGVLSTHVNRFGFMVVSLVVLSTSAMSGGIEELQKFIDHSATGEAQFVQRVYDVSGDLVQESTGSLKFSRPGKFKWHYLKPYEQLLIGDGTYLWVYDPDLLQVTKISLDQALGSSPAALLYGSKDIDSYFGLEALSVTENFSRVRVLPYDENGLFERIEIGLNASTLQTMTLFDYFGQQTVIEFHDFVIPSTFSGDEFEFVVPDDVDVVTH